MPERAAEPLGYGLVIGSITYLSVVVGELVPKHLALKNAEGIACAVAPLMALISRIGAPVVWLLDASTKLIFRLFGQSTESDSAVTEEEIKTIMAEAETAGVIETDERKMIAGVMRLGDRAVRGVMTPRTDVDWIDLDDDEFDIRETLINTAHSRLPGGRGPSRQHARASCRPGNSWPPRCRDEPLDIRAHIRKAPIIPDTLDALDALEVLRQAEVPMALVHDEYGHFDGVVTPADILDAIAGAFRSDEGDSRAGGRAAGGRLLVARRLDAGRRDGRSAWDRPARAARLRDRRRPGDRRTPAPSRARARPSRRWAGASRSSTWTAGASTRCWPPGSRPRKRPDHASSASVSIVGMILYPLAAQAAACKLEQAIFRPRFSAEHFVMRSAHDGDHLRFEITVRRTGETFPFRVQVDRRSGEGTIEAITDGDGRNTGIRSTFKLYDLKGLNTSASARDQSCVLLRSRSGLR